MWSVYWNPIYVQLEDEKSATIKYPWAGMNLKGALQHNSRVHMTRMIAIPENPRYTMVPSELKRGLKSVERRHMKCRLLAKHTLYEVTLWCPFLHCTY